MEGYKSGDIPSTIMGRLATGYSDEDIAAMAGYFEKQKYVPVKQDADAAKVTDGANIAR